MIFSIINLSIAFPQIQGEVRSMITFEPGTNSMLIPSRSNISNDLEGESHFWSVLSPTLGFGGRLSVWPVTSPYFGYNYFFEESRGWLFAFTQNSKEYGHNMFLGYKNFRLNLTYSKAERKTEAYYYKSQSLSQGYLFHCSSEYYIQQRVIAGVEYTFRSGSSTSISYIMEHYDKLPSDLWAEYSNGFTLDFKKADKYRISIEGIIDHPVYGRRHVSPPQSELESLKYKSIYMKISLSKIINFSTRPYLDLDKLFGKF